MTHIDPETPTLSFNSPIFADKRVSAESFVEVNEFSTTDVYLGSTMPQEPSKRLSTASVVALVFLPIFVGLFLVAVVIGGWLYLGRHHSEEAALESTTASANTTPSLDMNSAVAILRGNAKPELRAAALAALEQQAKSGNAKAMVMTAACYRAGLGTVHDDLFKAFEWYRKAAQAGEPVAMVEMSHYYTEGVWVEANAAESKRWLERAAQAGNAEAKWQLAKGGK